MADILIKNMELPRTLTIYPNGDIDELIAGKYVTIGKAIELPPHGRLGDLDELYEHEKYNVEEALFDAHEVLDDIQNAPVIVEASE